MGLQFAVFLAFVLGTIASVAVSQELPSFIFFSTLDTNVNTSPLYLVTRNTLEEAPFDAPVICSSGAWFACYHADDCNTRFFKESNCWGGYLNGFTSAVLFGNSSDMSQKSFTFFTDRHLKGNMSETYFEDAPEFSGAVSSLILTGVESATSLSLFTQTHYFGLEYCVNLGNGGSYGWQVDCRRICLHWAAGRCI